MLTGPMYPASLALMKQQNSIIISIIIASKRELLSC